MSPIEEIDQIIDRIIGSDMEVSDFVIVGIAKMQELQYEFLNRYRHYGNGHIGGMQIFQIFTKLGMLTIRVNPDLPPDHLSVGRITLNDFIIEDILLDDKDYSSIDSNSNANSRNLPRSN